MQPRAGDLHLDSYSGLLFWFLYYLVPWGGYLFWLRWFGGLDLVVCAFKLVNHISSSVLLKNEVSHFTSALILYNEDMIMSYLWILSRCLSFYSIWAHACCRVYCGFAFLLWKISVKQLGRSSFCIGLTCQVCFWSTSLIHIFFLVEEQFYSTQCVSSRECDACFIGKCKFEINFA